MANKKVSQLTSKPSVLVTDLFPIADPTTGQLFKTTISALGTAIGSGVSSVNTLVGAVVLDTDDIQELASPTNRWYTDTRSRAALSAGTGISYNSGTGVITNAVTSGQIITALGYTPANPADVVPYTGATGNVDLGIHSLIATQVKASSSAGLSLNSNNGTQVANLGAGGGANITFYGGLTGTTATFTNAGSGIGLGVTLSGSTGDGIKITHSAGRAFNIQSSGSGYGVLINNETASTSAPFTIQKQGSAVVTFTDAGVLTLSGALNATAGNFSGDVTLTGGNPRLYLTDSDNNPDYFISNTDGTFTVYDVTNSTSRLTLSNLYTTLNNTLKVEGDILIKQDSVFGPIAGYTGIGSDASGIFLRLGTASSHAYLILSSLTNYRNFTLPDATGTFALTSDLSAYLPLSGGTLTGALSGTSATFSGLITYSGTSQILNAASGTTGYLYQYLQNTGGSAYFGLERNTGGGLFTNSTAYSTVLGSANATDLHLGSNGIVRLTIASTGAATFSGPYIEVAGSGVSSPPSGLNYGFFPQASIGLGLSSLYGMTFWTGTTPTERMRITSGGAVLVGTQSSTGLATGSSVNVGILIGTGAVNSQVNNNSNIYLSKATGFTSGDLTAHFVNGTYVGGISTNGTTTTYAVASDYRLKEDLKAIKGLEILNKIKVYDYKWKASDERMDGVIAHELQEVIPYAVTGIKDGERMQAVDYSKIVPVLIQAIKDQQVQIEQLKNK
jgi:hypothetical protein